ncbi:hypothetical protein NUW58_g5429 [Xylaria curta]|uniref:Uncharacterized protein n=1 Tax=Xylaria curta TaxID=42375 RepID=A0ACC1P1R3_9PEZI|nr:hypothetical protein NUW58_g5429 [Xylaria curta]
MPSMPNILRQPLSFVRVRRAATLPAGPSGSGALQQGLVPPSHLQPITQKDHPQYDLPSRGAITLGRKRLPMVGAMKFWNDSSILHRAVASFVQDETKEPKRLVEKPEYSIRGVGDWSDVWQKLVDAKKKFDGSESKSRSRVKRAYRAAADLNSEAQSLMDLVPDSDSITPVKAVLGLLLETVKNTSDARQKITGTFDETRVMEVFAKVEEFLATFPEDEIISDLCVDLVACMFKAVEGTIDYFLSSTWSRAFNAMPLIGSGQEPLLDTIAKIEIKSQKLVEEAQTSHVIDTREMRKDVHRVEHYQYYTIEGVNYVVQMTNDIYTLLNDGAAAREKPIMREQIKEMHHAVDELKRQNNSGESSKTQTAPPTPPPQQSPWQPPQPSSWYPAPAYWGQPQYAGYAPPTYLLAYYHIPQQQQPPDPIIVADTLLSILGTAGPASSTGAVQTRLLRPEEFYAWATSPDSRELLVQGDPAQDVTQAGPALSLLSATIIQALQNQERFVPLVFFCVQQVQSDDAPVGPVAMIQSLIVQLIHQCYADSTFGERDVDIRGLQTGDIGALCSLFRFLARHVAPQKTIACVIDGVGEYENGEYDGDLRTVLDCILSLTRADDVLSAVKVLVTCHAGTVEVHNAFKEDTANFLSLEGFSSIGDEGAMMDIENELQ